METDLSDTVHETWTVVVDADTSPLARELQSANRYGRQFSTAMVSAFDGLAFKGKSFSDVLGGLAQSLSRLALQAAFKPLEVGFGNLFTGLLQGGGGSLFSQSGAVAGGLPVPFASGGVISAPVGFPLGNGRMGLAGERGAEAILPLSRGADGRLGIAAAGGGGPSITVHIATPDADSFRRSEGQIASMIARAAALGQRQL